MHLIDVAFHAITTAWLRKWMHAEPISELLVKENAPGDDRVNTFDEWAAYTRSNAIVGLVSPLHNWHSKNLTYYLSSA